MEISLLARRSSDLSELCRESLKVKPSDTLNYVLEQLPSPISDSFEIRTVFSSSALGKSLQHDHTLDKLHISDGDCLFAYLREKPESIIFEDYVVVGNDANEVNPPRYSEFDSPTSESVAKVNLNSRRDDQIGKDQMEVNLSAMRTTKNLNKVRALAIVLAIASAKIAACQAVTVPSAIEAITSQNALAPTGDYLPFLRSQRTGVITSALPPSRPGAGSLRQLVPVTSIETNTLKVRGITTLVTLITTITIILVVNWLNLTSRTHHTHYDNASKLGHIMAPNRDFNTNEEITRISEYELMIELLLGELRILASVMANQTNCSADEYGGQSTCMQYIAALQKCSVPISTNIRIAAPFNEPQHSDFPDTGSILVILSATSISVLRLRVYNNVNYVNGNNNRVDQSIR
ncbi:hypothetical protein F4680DRAFT_470129 [Xylaria scruposa]|nr:hypothetical protein F4680DRAFT_470129 [Xylaria scruposa]